MTKFQRCKEILLAKIVLYQSMLRDRDLIGSAVLCYLAQAVPINVALHSCMYNGGTLRGTSKHLQHISECGYPSERWKLESTATIISSTSTTGRVSSQDISDTA